MTADPRTVWLCDTGDHAGCEGYACPCPCHEVTRLRAQIDQDDDWQSELIEVLDPWMVEDDVAQEALILDAVKRVVAEVEWLRAPEALAREAYAIAATTAWSPIDAMEAVVTAAGWLDRAEAAEVEVARLRDALAQARDAYDTAVGFFVDNGGES